MAKTKALRKTTRGATRIKETNSKNSVIGSSVKFEPSRNKKNIKKKTLTGKVIGVLQDKSNHNKFFAIEVKGFDRPFHKRDNAVEILRAKA